MQDPQEPQDPQDPQGPPTPHDDAADLAALARHADDLVAAAEAVLAGWVERSVRTALATQSLTLDDAGAARLAAAAAEARDEGARRLRDLLARDIDDQRTNPLSILRGLVRHPTAVLRAAGARPVARDEFAERNFPDDVYDLTPAAFADVDPALHEPGLVWGAAKAHVHLARRRRLG
jgi:hypothetical protein